MNKAKVTNIPNKIYLQVGEINEDSEFNDLDEVTWCKEKALENDIKFIHEAHAIECFRKFIEDYCKDAGYNDICNNSVHFIEGFKQLLNK
jgi:hypothetical protein